MMSEVVRRVLLRIRNGESNLPKEPVELAACAASPGVSEADHRKVGADQRNVG